MYGLIQTQTRSPFALRRVSMPRGSGKLRASQTKSHQLSSRIQNASKWNTLTGGPVRPSLDEAADRRLVVGRGERCAEPEAERPGRRQGRPASQRRVLLENLLWVRAVDHEILERVALDAELDARDRLRGDLEGDAAGVVDEDPVPLVVR